MIDFCTVHCPYCGEPIELTVDTSAGAQTYIEDCQVCCQPMTVAVAMPEPAMAPEVLVSRDD